MTTSFTYDAVDQLLTESRPGYSASYTYDANGNRTSKTVGGLPEIYVYDLADKLLSTSTKTYGYDAMGRTTSVIGPGGTTTLTYDIESRVTSISGAAGSSSYTYNGLNTRVGKVEGGVTSTYKRDGAYVTDPVLSDGAATYTPGISERRGGASGFNLSDYLGTNGRMVNAAGTTTGTRSYDAFGLLLSSTGSNPSPFGFAGSWGYQEDASGLKLLGHRYYDASTGRFLSRDPIKDGRNWYAYAEGNPTGAVDPTGLKLRLVGFTKEQEKKVRKHIRLIERASRAGRQLIFDLVNDKADHIISPPNKPGDPHFNPGTGRLRYDPNESLTLPTHGEGGKAIPSPPDVILIHELGHMYGRRDPGDGKPGTKVRPGDNIYDFENRHRRVRKLPRRDVY